MPHRILDASNPVIGFLWATISTVSIWLSQAVSEVSPISKGWIELGGTIGLIGGLSYGCITLWKEIQAQKTEARNEREKHHSEIAALNLEIRIEKREQNDKLIAVLEKLDPDKG